MSKRPGRLVLHRGWRGRLAVTFGLLGFVATVYTVVVLGGGALLGVADSPSLPLSILATVVVALSFARVQSALERVAATLGLGGAQTPYDVLSQFSETVTGSPSTAEMTERMAKVLAEGTGALWAQVWLVVDDALVLGAAWPQGVARDLGAPSLPPGVGTASASGQRTLAVRHGAEILGVLRLQERPGQALTTVEQRLFEGLAAQAGLALRQAGLQRELEVRHDELVEQAGELRASRERLIRTQDAERRRLERDMHDGAQQHLVALAVNLRLAQALAGHSPDRAAEVVASQAAAAVEAISTLSAMSRGIYPRLLADDGLVPALRSAVVTSSVPVTLGAGDLGRLPTAVEAALYFCALEAVQNATKHAGAGRVRVDLGQDTDVWWLRVRDDGIGFDHDGIRDTGSGGGLLNMSDRLSAVGGSVSVTSERGTGTTVTAVVARGAPPPARWSRTVASGAVT
ncbi:hypothetical protein GCM10023168_23500 [Fodinibacter luteus]|uniref:histidine kinase n=1 Tax=Fodinibacter luteus TaxID=552064 RepID=A0ABP8KIP2_9MICO